MSFVTALIEAELDEATSTHHHVNAEKCMICSRLRPMLVEAARMDALLGDALADYDRRRATLRGRFLLWLLTRLT